MTCLRSLILFATMLPTLLMITPLPVQASDAAKTVTISYELTAKGREFGAMQVTRTPGMHGEEEILRQLKATAMTLENGQRLQVSESALFSRDGQLWEYSARLKGADTYEIRLLRDKETLDIKLMVNGNATSCENVQTGDVDYTSQYLPMDKLGPEQSASYRLLSLDELSVVGAEVRKGGRERLEISDRTFDCTVVSQSTGSTKTKKWMAKDANGYWFAVKEEIRSDKGGYTVTLTGYRISQ